MFARIPALNYRDFLRNIPEQQPVTGKDRVSCEVNSIGATGVKPPLNARTPICIGARTTQSV
jgi:hypothetical protein